VEPSVISHDRQCRRANLPLCGEIVTLYGHIKTTEQQTIIQ